MHIGRLLSVALLLACVGQAQSDKPDFTGVWVLNTTRSKLTIPKPPVTSTFIFIQRGTKWHMERTHFFRDEKPNTIQFDRVIGSEPVVEHHDDYVESSRMFWESNTVVLDEQFAGSDNTHGSNHVTYSLSADANQLTALEVEVFPDAKYTNRWVFDRLPLPALVGGFPGTGMTARAVAKLKRTIERDHGDCDPKGSKLEIDYALVDLGKLGPAVIVRSSRPCDCGATGNCVMYLYQRHGDAFHELPFRNDASPWGSSYGIVRFGGGAIFLVTASHMSAFVGGRAFYEFFGGMFTGLGSACVRADAPESAIEEMKIMADCDARGLAPNY